MIKVRAYTHTIAALVFGLIIIKLGLFSLLSISSGGFLTLVILGSLLPDLDHQGSKIGRKFPLLSKLMQFLFSHRGFYHSVFGLFLTLLFFFLVSRVLSIGAWKLVLLAIGFGFTAHLVMDSLTSNGVRWFHPFKKIHLKGPVKTGGLSELVLFVIFVFLLGVLIRDFGSGLIRFI